MFDEACFQSKVEDKAEAIKYFNTKISAIQRNVAKMQDEKRVCAGFYILCCFVSVQKKRPSPIFIGF